MVKTRTILCDQGGDKHTIDFPCGKQVLCTRLGIKTITRLHHKACVKCKPLAKAKFIPANGQEFNPRGVRYLHQLTSNETTKRTELLNR